MLRMNKLLNQLAVFTSLLTGGIIYLFFFQPTYFRIFSNLFEQKFRVGESEVSIDQVRSIAELATVVSYHQAIVPIRDTREFGGVEVGETSVIYIAAAQVTAGFDLSKMTAANVETEQGSTKLRMPPPKILSIALLPDKSEIWDVNKKWLAPDTEAYLVEQAQKEAIQKIRNDICGGTGTILDTASLNASILISNLFLNEGIVLSVQPQDWTVADCLKDP